jgi:hypothetical protein
MDYLHWLEQTALGVWLREGESIWSYPLVLYLHTAGLAILVGSASVIDLRLLGVASAIPLPTFDRIFRYVWFGFWVNAISGTALLVASASTKLLNPMFYIKMVIIGFGVWITYLMRRRVFREHTSNGRLYAAVSLALWLGAITAGRLLAYTGINAGAS